MTANDIGATFLQQDYAEGNALWWWNGNKWDGVGTLRGTLSAIPTADTRFNGMYYEATDFNRVYICTGAAWVDEIAGYDINTQQMTWDMLQFGLRLGTNPRCVVTTTPKPTPLIQKLVELARNPVNKVIITTGSTYENKSNLAAPFMRQITQYEGTNLGRQEIYAELIDIEESGIIKRNWFKQWPTKKAMPPFEFVIQSYDTAFTERTENDPTGMVAFGVFRPGPDEPHCVMILDAWTDHLKYPELRKRAQEEYRVKIGRAHV